MPVNAPHHIMKRFDQEMDDVKKLILSMGALVERAIENAISSIINQDESLARKTIERDKTINALEVECDELTRNIMVRRQPAAGDLRFIIAIIKLVEDLEHMGDLAASIATTALQTSKQPSNYYDSIETMGEKVVEQMHNALDALARGDIEMAIDVIARDKKIDKRHRAMQREVLTYMMEDPRSISQLLNLSTVAKQLERISDHAVNVAKLVIYITSGQDVRHIDIKAVKELVNYNNDKPGKDKVSKAPLSDEISNEESEVE
ncbi:MAG: phosphate signaling complex protein PhoU [Zetaproteobacteria bacterium]|nr:phosphate signaling complex protein PhoU [Zetaproteobacteria bacterium]